MNTQDINLKLFIPSIVITIIAIILIFTHSTSLVIDSVGYVLGFYRELAYVFWFIVFICLTCYYINIRNIEEKRTFTSGLGPTVDFLSSVATYGTTFHTSIIMLNGVFKQYFYGYEFIKDVGYTELFIIAIPMFYLLFWSIIRIINLGEIAYKHSGKTTKVKAVNG